MKAEAIRKMTVDAVPDNPGGTGPEEEFRNFMLQEIAAQLANISELMQLFYQHR